MGQNEAVEIMRAILAGEIEGMYIMGENPAMSDPNLHHSREAIGGITWERLNRESSVTYPCRKEGDPGEPIIFKEAFPTATGKGRFVPASLIPAVVDVHPEDLAALGGIVDEPITVSSRRGAITGYARADDRLHRGEIFIPFCYVEAAANLLTNEALNPFGKIPEFKYCAVTVAPGGTVRARPEPERA